MKLTKKISVALAAALVLSLATPASLPASPAAVVSAATKAPKISATKKTLNVGKSFTLKVSNAQKVTWKSNKTSVATVNKNGKVSAIKSGTATITATADKKKLTCKVTVKNPALSKVNFTGKEYVYENMNLIVPKAWETQSASANGAYQISSSPNFTDSKEGFNLLCQKTGTKALDYETLKEVQLASLTAEALEASFTSAGYSNVKVSNIENVDYNSPLGTSLRVTYNMEGTAEGETISLKISQYYLSIDNYVIVYQSVIDLKSDDPTAYILTFESIFDSITFVK